MDNNSEEKDENATEIELSAMDSRELDEADLNVMKGDTIGNTVYSAKWIINTLIPLSKMYEDAWSESHESDLCMLWDMTVEKDIVDFLMANDFLRIAEFVLKESKEPRLTEIILGIVDNMCCQPTVLGAVANENNLVFVIFGLLSTDDPETLIQILRLLQIAVWDIQKNEQTKWLQHFKDCKFLGDAISFILQNSTNDGLLIAATDLLQSISVVRIPGDNSLLSDMFKVDQLMPALLESFTQLVPIKQDVHSRTELKVIENWLTIFSNIMQSEFTIFSRDKSDNNFTKIMCVLLRILQPYKYSFNLVPLDERVALCIHECVEIVFWFQRNKMHPNVQIVHVIIAIMHGLRLAVKGNSGMDSFMEPNETIIELVKYLERYWLETLNSYEENELSKIIELCENELTKCLMEVTTQYSEEFRHAVEKLLRVQSLH